MDQSLGQAGCRVQLLLSSLPLCDLLQISPFLVKWIILRETQTLWLSSSIPWSPEILRQLYGTLTDLKGKAAWVGVEHSQCHVGITTWRSSTGLPVKMLEGIHFANIMQRSVESCPQAALYCLFLLSSFFLPYISEANPNLVEFISLHALGWTTHHRAESRKVQIFVYSYCNLLHFSTCMGFFLVCFVSPFKTLHRWYITLLLPSRLVLGLMALLRSWQGRFSSTGLEEIYRGRVASTPFAL